jgi:hypothetical protein
MSEHTEGPSTPREASALTATHPYEPPRVERLLTQEDLEREVLYAGAPPGPSPIEW